MAEPTGVSAHARIERRDSIEDLMVLIEAMAYAGWHVGKLTKLDGEGFVAEFVSTSLPSYLY